MIGVYENPGLDSFSLLNIEYNLALIWLNVLGDIVYLVDDAQACKTNTYKNTKPAKCAIAVTAVLVAYDRISKRSNMMVISF
jgi:hypothetical protein